MHVMDAAKSHGRRQIAIVLLLKMNSARRVEGQPVSQRDGLEFSELRFAIRRFGLNVRRSRR